MHPAFKFFILKASNLSISTFFTIAFGSIVGVGWLVAIGGWVGTAGPIGGIVAFLLGGIATMLIGLCYAEIATIFPFKGGEIAYAFNISGKKLAFITSWALLLAVVSTIIFEAITFSWMLQTIFPTLKGGKQLGNITTNEFLFGGSGIFVMMMLHYFGTKTTAKTQKILVYVELGIAAVFIGTAFILGDTANLIPAFKSNDTNLAWKGIFAVFITTPFWLWGYNNMTQLLHERNQHVPLNKLGRVFVMAIGIACLFFCLVIIACSMPLPWQQMTTLDLPAANVFEKAFNVTWIGKLVLITGFLCNLSIWNAMMMAGTKILQTMGNIHFLPPAFARTHKKYNSPVTAIWVTSLLCLIGVLAGKKLIGVVVNVGSISCCIIALIVCISVVRLRKQQPQLPRPYKIPGGIYTAILSVMSTVFILILSFYLPWQSMQAKTADAIMPLEWWFTLLWVVLGVVCWLFMSGRRKQFTKNEMRDFLNK